MRDAEPERPSLDFKPVRASGRRTISVARLHRRCVGRWSTTSPRRLTNVLRGPGLNPDFKMAGGMRGQAAYIPGADVPFTSRVLEISVA